MPPRHRDAVLGEVVRKDTLLEASGTMRQSLACSKASRAGSLFVFVTLALALTVSPVGCRGARIRGGTAGTRRGGVPGHGDVAAASVAQRAAEAARAARAARETAADAEVRDRKRRGIAAERVRERQRALAAAEKEADRRAKLEEEERERSRLARLDAARVAELKRRREEAERKAAAEAARNRRAIEADEREKASAIAELDRVRLARERARAEEQHRIDGLFSTALKEAAQEKLLLRRRVMAQAPPLGSGQHGVAGTDRPLEQRLQERQPGPRPGPQPATPSLPAPAVTSFHSERDDSPAADPDSALSSQAYVSVRQSAEDAGAAVSQWGQCSSARDCGAWEDGRYTEAADRTTDSHGSSTHGSAAADLDRIKQRARAASEYSTARAREAAERVAAQAQARHSVLAAKAKAAPTAPAAGIIHPSASAGLARAAARAAAATAAEAERRRRAAAAEALQAEIQRAIEADAKIARAAAAARQATSAATLSGAGEPAMSPPMPAVAVDWAALPDCAAHGDCGAGGFCAKTGRCDSRSRCTPSPGFPRWNPINGVCPMDIVTPAATRAAALPAVKFTIAAMVARASTERAEPKAVPGAVVQVIEVESSHRLESVTFKYVDGSHYRWHAGNTSVGAARRDEFRVPRGQYVSKIKTRVGGEVAGLRLVTNAGQSSPWFGGWDGRQRTFGSGDCEIWALHRQSGDALLFTDVLERGVAAAAGG